MNIISGFFVYKVYISYKSHFTQPSADISKYGFNLFNIPYETFLKTKGHMYYDKIAKIMKKENEVVSLFISAFLDNPSVWIGDICLNINHYIELKNKREGRILNLPYLFRKDCKYMLERGMVFDNTIAEFVYEEFMMSNIELETFIIFKKIFNFSLDNNVTYDYIYKGKYEKYEFLIKIDENKYKKILEEAIMLMRD